MEETAACQTYRTWDEGGADVIGAPDCLRNIYMKNVVAGKKCLQVG